MTALIRLVPHIYQPSINHCYWKRAEGSSRWKLEEFMRNLRHFGCILALRPYDNGVKRQTWEEVPEGRLREVSTTSKVEMNRTLIFDCQTHHGFSANLFRFYEDDRVYWKTSAAKALFDKVTLNASNLKRGKFTSLGKFCFPKPLVVFQLVLNNKRFIG